MDSFTKNKTLNELPYEEKIRLITLHMSQTIYYSVEASKLNVKNQTLLKHIRKWLSDEYTSLVKPKKDLSFSERLQIELNK